MFGRTIRAFFLATVTMLLSVSPVFAQSPAPEVTIQEALEATVDGPYFVAEEKVVLDKMYLGTVFALGGEVAVDGLVDGDLVVAGGSVTISGDVMQDVYVAGGTVIIDGVIEGNVIAAGGEVRLVESAEVGGSFIAAGERVLSLGVVTNQLRVMAKNADLAGFVGGKATVQAQTISGQDSVEVSGEKQFVERPQEEKHEDPGMRLAAVPIAFSGSFLWRAVFFAMFFFFAKGLVQRGAEVVAVKPVVTLLNGISAVVLIPIALIFLALTVIGFPIGIVLILVLLTLGLTGWVFLALALGKKIWAAGPEWAQGLLGSAVLAVLSIIPVVHWFAGLVIGAWGVGVWLQTFQTWSILSVEKPVTVVKTNKTSAKKRKTS